MNQPSLSGPQPDQYSRGATRSDAYVMPYMLVRSVWLTDEAAFVSYKHDSPRLPDQHRRRTQSRTSGDDMPNPPPEVTYQRQISAQETEEGLFRDTSAWGLISRMRAWRQDAIVQHLYQTAVFWGDKVFAWTSEYHQLNISHPEIIDRAPPRRSKRCLLAGTSPFLDGRLPQSRSNSDFTASINAIASSFIGLASGIHAGRRQQPRSGPGHAFRKSTGKLQSSRLAPRDTNRRLRCRRGPCSRFGDA